MPNFFLTLAIEILLLAALFIGLLALAGLLPGVNRSRLFRFFARDAQASLEPSISVKNSSDSPAPASAEPPQHAAPPEPPTRHH